MPEPSTYQALKELLLSPPLPNVDLFGKTVIVLGANSGIGFEATKHFASMNPGKLILVCRSKEKGDAALAEIQNETGCQALEVWIADLSVFSSVITFVERFEKEGGRLDILLANAAILASTREYTVDGWEETCQVNLLSIALLSLLLLPRMLETAKRHETTPRLVLVSSGMQYNSRFDKGSINAPNFLRSYGHKDEISESSSKVAYSGVVAYSETKLLGFFFIRALSARLQKQPVITNLADPGLCVTSISRRSTGIIKWFFAFANKTFARTAEVGSRSLIFAAVGAEDKKDELRGKFVNALSEIIEGSSSFAESDEGQLAQDVTWDNLIQELSKIEPKIQQIVQEYLA